MEVDPSESPGLERVVPIKPIITMYRRMAPHGALLEEIQLLTQPQSLA